MPDGFVFFVADNYSVEAFDVFAENGVRAESIG